jgi:hypothetical protein
MAERTTRTLFINALLAFPFRVGNRLDRGRAPCGIDRNRQELARDLTTAVSYLK